MKFIVKNHNDLKDVEKAYSFILNTQKSLGKNMGELLNESHNFPCFKKILNENFFKELVSLGKVTSTFLSYYDGIEHISRRKLFNPGALNEVLVKKGEDEELSRKVVSYLIALYIEGNEDARKEIYFLVYNINKKLFGQNLFMVELEEIDKELNKYVLCKSEPDEDGSIPKPDCKGASLLETIGRRTISLDIGVQNELAQIIEDQLNLCEDEDACNAFLNIANIIGLSVEL